MSESRKEAFLSVVYVVRGRVCGVVVLEILQPCDKINFWRAQDVLAWRLVRSFACEHRSSQFTLVTIALLVTSSFWSLLRELKSVPGNYGVPTGCCCGGGDP